MRQRAQDGADIAKPTDEDAKGGEEGGNPMSRALSTTVVRISHRQEEIARRARMALVWHMMQSKTRAEGGKPSLRTPPFPQPCSSLDPK